ncbi:MAG: hypothetical protein AAFP04_08820 [Myxococcota bacterium]
MAVKKYRSIEEMPDTGSVRPDSLRFAEIFAEVLEFNSLLSPSRAPSGVHKFSSVEELNLHRERWTKS